MQAPVKSPPSKAYGGDSFHEYPHFGDKEVVMTKPLDSRFLKCTHTKQRGALFKNFLFDSDIFNALTTPSVTNISALLIQTGQILKSPQINGLSTLLSPQK